MGIINTKFFSTLTNSKINPQNQRGYYMKGLSYSEAKNKLINSGRVPKGPNEVIFRMQNWESLEYPEFGDNIIIYFSRFLFWLISNSVFFIIINILLISYFYNETEVIKKEPNSTTTDGNEAAIKGVAGVYSILLALMFTNAITRYKESKKLYDALCGDVKAFAIWLSTLSQDSVKYNYSLSTYVGEGLGRGLGLNQAKLENKQIDDTFDKMRMLLAVLAPLAKRVVRHAHHESIFYLDSSSKPDIRRLDDKYRIKETKTCGCFTKYTELSKLKLFCELPDKKCYEVKEKKRIQLKGIQQRVTLTSQKTNLRLHNKTYAEFERAMQNAEGSDRQIEKVYDEYKDYDFTSWGSPGQCNTNKRELYRKVKDVSEKTGMNLFECALYCLLDYVNEVNELEMGIDGGNERDLILKWNHIYNSYGALMSYNTYMQPLIIRFAIVVSLYIYTIAVTVSMKENGESMLVVFGSTSPYIVLWVITQLLFSPFSKRTFFLVDNVSRVGRDTQREVNKLLECRKFFDLRDMKRRKDPDIELGDEIPKYVRGPSHNRPSKKLSKKDKKKILRKKARQNIYEEEEQPLLEF